MSELAAKLKAAMGVTAHSAPLSRVLLKAGLSFKRTLVASEAEREEWKAPRQPFIRQDVHCLVFLDETGTTAKMPHQRGHAPLGSGWPMHRSATGAHRSSMPACGAMA